MRNASRIYLSPNISIYHDGNLFATGCGYDYSSGVEIDEGVILHLSWLGPFANYDWSRPEPAPKEKAEERKEKVEEIRRKLQEVLEDNNVITLSNEELDEPADWIDESASLIVKVPPAVWFCLFREW